MPGFYADPVRELERHELPLPIAFLLSALLFALTAAVAILCCDRSPPAAPKPTIVRVVLLQLPTPPAPPQLVPPPEPLPPPPSPVILPVRPAGTIVLSPPAPAAPSPRPPRRPVRPRHVTHVRVVSRPAKPPQISPQDVVPFQTGPPAPTPASRPAASDPAARDSLEGRIRQAIGAAFRFPQAAREMGSHGTAVVGFLYRDRIASSIHLVSSSRSSVLDREAIQIVRDAAMPPPGKLAGQTLNLQVPIVFDLVSEDD